MRLILPLFFLCASCFCADNDAFRAKLNVDKSKNMVFTGLGMMYLPAEHSQKGDVIAFEAEQMHGLNYHFPNVRLQKEQDRISITHVRFLEFHFEVGKPGKYRAWYLASYPTNLGYQHGECMDDGEVNKVIDSERLAPNVWRWHEGPVYNLTKGKHVWSFPSPHAWCGGTKLDKLLLIPETQKVDPAKVNPAETVVRMPESGEVTLRRIKASSLKQWQLNAATELNGGKFIAEYRYDDHPYQAIKFANWENVPGNSKYLFFRFRLERSKENKLSPFIYNVELQVREK